MSIAAGGQAPRVLFGVTNPQRERELREHLTAAGFQVVERCLDGQTLADRAQRLDSDVALVSADLHRLSAPLLLAMNEARLPVVLLGEKADFERYEGLAHLIAAQSSLDEVVEAVHHAMALGVAYARPNSSNGIDSGAWPVHMAGSGTGKVLTLISGKGAPGVTTIAIGLAHTLSAHGLRVVLVDADLRAGNVLAYLNLSPMKGILGLTAGARDGAMPHVEGELQDGQGFRVLAGLERPEDHSLLRPALVTAALAGLRDLADIIIVDGGQVTSATSSPVTETLLRQADGVLLACTGDLVGAWNARCCQRHLVEHLGISPGGIALILNRYEGRGQYKADELASLLGLEALGVVPEDRRAARRAVEAQSPISSGGGRLGRAFQRLANDLTGPRSTPAGVRTGRRWPIRRLAAGGKR